MCTLFVWAIFGFLVGCLAKFLHPGDEPAGFGPTILIGVAGSFIGGGINYVLNLSDGEFAPGGFLMSVVGGVICCAIWRWWDLKNSPQGPKSFFTGKKLR